VANTHLKNKRNLSFGVSKRVSGVSPSATQHKVLYIFLSFLIHQKKNFPATFTFQLSGKTAI